MHSKTFKLNGATIEVAPETGAIYIDKMVAEITLEVHSPDTPTRVAFHRQQYAAAYAHSKIVDGHLGFEWPDSPNNKEAMLTACDAWLQLPGNDVARWISTINEVQLPPNDPDLLPAEMVSQKKGKSQKS